MVRFLKDIINFLLKLYWMGLFLDQELPILKRLWTGTLFISSLIHLLMVAGRRCVGSA